MNVYAVWLFVLPLSFATFQDFDAPQPRSSLGPITFASQHKSSGRFSEAQRFLNQHEPSPGRFSEAQRFLNQHKPSPGRFSEAQRFLNQHEPSPGRFSEAQRFLNQHEPSPGRFSAAQRFLNQHEPHRHLAGRLIFAERQKSQTVHGRNPSAATTSDCPKRCRCKYRGANEIDVVDCSNKGLTEIPIMPASAEEIYLQNNKISKIPCQRFKYLKNLRKLDLSRNMIKRLQTCTLVHVEYSLEFFKTLQNESTSPAVGVFDSLSDLHQLNLSENLISKISPNYFIHMGSLMILDISQNNLTKIRNNTFIGLNYLLFLSLTKNMLRYLPETFERDAFLGMASLESLHLEGNQPYFIDNFTYPDQALAQIPTLRHLWLDGYPSILGSGVSSLMHLSYLSFTSFNGGFCVMSSSLPPRFFYHVATEQPLSIDLSGCDIFAIPPQVFEFLPTIETLICLTTITC